MPQRLRILTPLHSFEPGGVERVALRLNAAWVAQGVDAQVVLGRSDGAMRTEAPALDYRVLDSHGIQTGAFETLWMIARLPGIIRAMQPDIVFCPGNSYSIVVVAMKLLLGRRCPPIIAKISNDLFRADLPQPIRWFYHCWLRLQGLAIDRFVAMAEPLCAEIVALAHVSPSRVSVIEDPALTAADVARLAGLEHAPHHGRRFLAIGRLAQQKNFPLLLRAFARMAGSEDRLTILGEGSARPALEKLATSLGIADRLAMPGHVNPLDPWLASHDRLVMSSDYEGVPAVVLEALAAGLPVTSTDCSAGMAMLLGDGRLGTLVPVGDEAALAAAMAAPPPPGFSAVAACAQAARFTVEAASAQYLGAMASLIGSRPAPAEAAIA